MPGTEFNDLGRKEGRAKAAKAQWRQVADQIRPKVPKLATPMDQAEAGVLADMTLETIAPLSHDPIVSLPAKPARGPTWPPKPENTATPPVLHHVMGRASSTFFLPHERFTFKLYRCASQLILKGDQYFTPEHKTFLDVSAFFVVIANDNFSGKLMVAILIISCATKSL